MPPNRFTIEWSHAALAAFYKLSFHAATMVDQAVIQLAEKGQGRLEWAAPYHRLLIGPFDLPIAIDREARTITVINIIRLRSPRNE